jgi:hypothetical protein
MANNPEGHSPRWWRQHQERTASSPIVPKTIDKSAIVGMALYSWPVKLVLKSVRLLRKSRFWVRIGKKKNDLVGLLGLLTGFGSWGYSVLSPQPQLAVGLILMGIAFVCLALLIIHIFEFKAWGSIIVLAAVSTSFWFYTHKIVITPAYKHELLSQLQEGYGLREECGSRQYYDQAPRFMGDAEERWMAQVHTTLKHAAKVDDLQLWEQSDIVGLVRDSNLIGFRCTRMAAKTGALETIIARHYDPSIRSNPYNGPIYVLDPQKGGTIKLPGNGANVILSTPPS